MRYLANCLLAIFLFFNISAWSQSQWEEIDGIYQKTLRKVLREPVVGFKNAKEIITISKESKHEKGIFLAKSLQAFAHFQINQLDSSVFLLLETIPELERYFPNSFYTAIAKNYLGRTYSRINNLAKAETAFKESSEIFMGIDSISYYCMVLNNYGTILGTKGDHSGALNTFLSVVKLSTEHAVALNFKSSALSNISYIYQLEQQNNKALEYALQGLDIDKKINNPRAIAESYNIIGTIYLNQNKLDSALNYYNKALGIESSDNRRLQSIQNSAKVNIAKVYAERGDLKRAIEILRNTNTKEYASEKIYLQLADYYKQLFELDSAIVYAKQSLAIATDQKIKPGVRDAAKVLQDIYTELNDFELANHFLNLHYAYKDSVHNESSEKRFTDLRIELAVLEKQQQIDALKQREAINKLRNRNLIIGLVTILFVIIILFFLYRWKQAQKEKLLKQELELNNKHLSNHTLNMVHKNNAFAEIEEEVRQMKKNEKPNYQRILNIVNRNRAEEKDWENFELYFGKVHKDFEIRIKSKFPTLSIGDFRLATLVKMNLTNTEIASILFIESKSVRMSKYRLKKKLGLGEKDDLLQFLATF